LVWDTSVDTMVVTNKNTPIHMKRNLLFMILFP